MRRNRNYTLLPQYQKKVEELRDHLENKTGMNVTCTQALYFAIEQQLRTVNVGAEA